MPITYTNPTVIHTDGNQPKRLIQVSINWSTLSKEEKRQMFAFLGFTEKERGRWYHPVMGLDIVINRIDFDLDTDQPFMIINKIFHAGRSEAKHEVVTGLKSLLGLS